MQTMQIYRFMLMLTCNALYSRVLPEDMISLLQGAFSRRSDHPSVRGGVSHTLSGETEIVNIIYVH